MSWRTTVQDYLRFTRKDRIGILVILFFILLVLLFPKFIARSTGSEVIAPDSAWIASMKSLEELNSEGRTIEEDEHSYQYDKVVNTYQPKGELFYFDPNSITESEWRKLGVRDKTIRTILNYRGKGGKFRKPEDLQKVYGLRQSEYDRLAPFIQITPAVSQSSPIQDPNDKLISKSFEKKYSRDYAVVDINTADTSALIALPGIGSKLAARIVSFREKLGGFYSIDQVRQTFGLPDSTFQKIKQYLKLENIQLRKININTATIGELKAHPYIRYGIANPMIAYRNEHGPFLKLEDIRNVMAVTNEVYEKIKFYLVVQ
jgi:competence protein ComEA